MLLLPGDGAIEVLKHFVAIFMNEIYKSSGIIRRCSPLFVANAATHTLELKHYFPTLNESIDGTELNLLVGS